MRTLSDRNIKIVKEYNIDYIKNYCSKNDDYIFVNKNIYNDKDIYMIKYTNSDNKIEKNIGICFLENIYEFFNKKISVSIYIEKKYRLYSMLSIFSILKYCFDFDDINGVRFVVLNDNKNMIKIINKFEDLNTGYCFHNDNKYYIYEITRDKYDMLKEYINSKY